MTSQTGPPVSKSLIVLLFVAAALLRVATLQAPGLALDREFRSAVIARALYFRHAENIEPWRQRVAEVSFEREPRLEPLVTEVVVAKAYWLAGRERLWIARLVTGAFWLIGGLFFHSTARRLLASEAAAIGTAYFLFVPLGVLVSRSFQPDTLMVAAFASSLYALVRYGERPSVLRWLQAAAATSLALLVKPLVLPALLGAFGGVAVDKRLGSGHRSLVRLTALLGTVLMPMLVYYAFPMFAQGMDVAGAPGAGLTLQVQMSMLPHLWARWEFWKGWLLTATDAAEWAAVILAVLGIPLLTGFSRRLVTGLWIGYLAFGLIFSLHSHTTNYYHLQLIPIVALSLGPPIHLLLERLRVRRRAFSVRVAVATALMLVLLFNAREIKRGLAPHPFESEKTAREIGEIVAHSVNTVYVAHHYGKPLQYLGELSGTFWPRRINYELYRRTGARDLSVEERLARIGFTPEYFIVTAFREFERHHRDLEAFLTSSCILEARTDDYLIYRACRPAVGRT